MSLLEVSTRKPIMVSTTKPLKVSTRGLCEKTVLRFNFETFTTFSVETIASYWVFSKIQKIWLVSLSLIKCNRASIYLLKNNIGNTRIMCEICLTVPFVNKKFQVLHTETYESQHRAINVIPIYLEQIHPATCQSPFAYFNLQISNYKLLNCNDISKPKSVICTYLQK